MVFYPIKVSILATTQLELTERVQGAANQFIVGWGDTIITGSDVVQLLQVAQAAAIIVLAIDSIFAFIRWAIKNLLGAGGGR